MGMTRLRGRGGTGTGTRRGGRRGGIVVNRIGSRTGRPWVKVAQILVPAPMGMFGKAVGDLSSSLRLPGLPSRPLRGVKAPAGQAVRAVAQGGRGRTGARDEDGGRSERRDAKTQRRA